MLLNDQAPWDDYAARVAELYRPLAPGDGNEESEIASAEARIGHRLPRLLREFYLLAGRRDDIHRTRNHLIPPEDLAIEQGALVIYEENLNQALWGIAVGEMDRDDPPVVRAFNDLTLTWEADHDRLSSFLVTMLYWQAASGGLPFAEAVDVDETELPEIRRHWPKVDLLGTLWDHLIVFHRGGQVLCVNGRAPALTLHAAGRTQADLDEIARRLKLDWDEPAPAEEGDGSPVV